MEVILSDLQQLIDMLPCMAFVESEGVIILQNDLACAETGLAPQESVTIERIFLGAFPFGSPDSSEPHSFDCILMRSTGQPAVVQGALRSIAPGKRLITAMERRKQEKPEGSLLGDLLDSAPEAMAITHDGRLLHVNREFTRLFLHSAESCTGQDIDSLLLPEGLMHENEVLYHMLATDGRGSMETQRLTSAGDSVDVSLLVAPVRLSGSTMGLFYTFRDIRSQKEQEARLHHNAMHDGLTGLANRALFLDRLQLTLARLRRRPDRHFAVLFLDLDRFKRVNDTLGHSAGDALLLEATRRLRDCVRPQDTVARFGGDEFAVLVDEAGTREDVGHIADRIQASVQKPVLYEGQSLFVSASIGIAVVTPEYKNAESVIRDADLAMYQAKAAGKARHAFAPAVGSGNARMQPWPGSARASSKTSDR